MIKDIQPNLYLLSIPPFLRDTKEFAKKIKPASPIVINKGALKITQQAIIIANTKINLNVLILFSLKKLFTCSNQCDTIVCQL